MDMKNLPLYARVENISNPEWGTFVVIAVHELWYEIRSRRGVRVLSKDEAERFWVAR